jgi:hypothetical protein
LKVTPDEWDRLHQWMLLMFLAVTVQFVMNAVLVAILWSRST